MAHTPDQRDTHQLCGARKKTGDTCRAFAGQGTSHPGVGRCKYHGGSTPTHVAGAAAQEAQTRMVALGAPVDVEPAEALLGVLRLSSGHVAWLREEVAAQASLATPEAQVVARLYGEERDRVGRLAKACLDAGVAERQVQLAERYGVALAELLRSVFADADLGLTPTQQALLPTVLRRHLSRTRGTRLAPAEQLRVVLGGHCKARRMCSRADRPRSSSLDR